jgi:hypothetical protein
MWWILAVERWIPVRVSSIGISLRTWAETGIAIVIKQTRIVQIPMKVVRVVRIVRGDIVG